MWTKSTGRFVVAAVWLLAAAPRAAAQETTSCPAEFLETNGLTKPLVHIAGSAEGGPTTSSLRGDQTITWKATVSLDLDVRAPTDQGPDVVYQAYGAHGTINLTATVI